MKTKWHIEYNKVRIDLGDNAFEDLNGGLDFEMFESKDLRSLTSTFSEHLKTRKGQVVEISSDCRTFCFDTIESTVWAHLHCNRDISEEELLTWGEFLGGWR